MRLLYRLSYGELAFSGRTRTSDLTCEVTELFTTGFKRIRTIREQAMLNCRFSVHPENRLVLYQLSYGHMNARRDSNPRPPDYQSK